MKKIYTLIAATAIVFSANAQRATAPVAPGKTIVNPKLKATHDYSARVHQGSRAGGPVWFNYGRDMDSPDGFTPGAASVNFMPLFPDSTITLGMDANNNPVAAWINKAGIYLDPRNMPVNSFGATDNYLMDSIGVEFAYVRNTDPTIVDTLRIQIIAQNSNNNYQLTSGTVPVYYQDITYDQPVNDLQMGGTYGMTVLKELKIPLTDVDTSSFNAVMMFETPGIPVQTGGKIIGAVVSFIPGYTWVQTDVLSTDKNAFYLVTLEQNGDNTDQDYYGNGTNASGDMNMSYILDQEIRYDINAQGWNGYFLPSQAYNTGYSYENHSVFFHLDNTTGVGINEFVNGVKVAQNMPNPFSTVSTINYELEKAAAVSLSVYDVAGKKIAEQSEGTQVAGSHTLSFNGANLAAGVYYYSLNVGENATTTMKMVVVK